MKPIRKLIAIIAVLTCVASSYAACYVGATSWCFDIGINTSFTCGASTSSASCEFMAVWPNEPFTRAYNTAGSGKQRKPKVCNFFGDYYNTCLGTYRACNGSANAYEIDTPDCAP
jgi:hypothetical protein